MVRQTLLGRIAIAVNANFDRFRQQTAAANRSTRQMASEMQRAQRRARQFRREIQQTGRRVRSFATLGATAFAGFALNDATRNFLAFDRALTRVNTLVGVSRQQTALWREDIINISRETAISTDQLADGLFNIVSIGQRGTEAMETLRAVARATAVGLGDFATVADTVTRIMSAYRTEGLRASEAIDVLFATIRLGNDRGEEFTRVFQEVVAQAATAGVQIGELGGLFSFLTTTGFTAQRSLVGLGQVLATIIRPSIRAKDALNAIGLGFQGLQEEVLEKGVVRAIRDVSERLEEAGLNISNVFRDKDAVVVARTVAEQWERAAGFVTEVSETSRGASQLGFDLLQQSTAFRLEQSIADIRRSLEDIAGRILPSIAENFNAILSVATGIAATLGLAAGVGLVTRLFRGTAALRAARAEQIRDNDRLLDQARELRQQGQAADRVAAQNARTLRQSGNVTEEQLRNQIALSESSQSFYIRRAEILQRVATREREHARALGLTRLELVGYTGAATAAGGATAFYLSQTEEAADATTLYNEALAERIRLEERYQTILEAYDPGGPDVGRFGPGGREGLLREIEGRLEGARLEEQATRRVADAYREFGDEAGAAQERLELLRRVRDEFLNSNRARFLDALGLDREDVEFLNTVNREIGQTYRNLFGLLGENSDVQRRLRELALDPEDAVDFSQVLPPIRRSAVEDYVRRANRALEDAQSSLRLSGATPFDREVDTETLRLQRFVADQLLSLDRERERVNRAIFEAKRSEAADSALVIRRQELILGQIDEEAAQVRALLDTDTERGRQARELIVARAEANRQLREDRAASTARARALEREERLIAERRETIRDATERAAEFTRDLVRGAERELRVAELTARLRGEGVSEAGIAGQVAVLEARQEIEERREDLIRRIARAESDIAIANAEHNAADLEAAELRLEALETELEATGELSAELERLGEARERIAELSEPINTLASETEQAFMRMEDSLDSFIRAAFKGEADFERFVNAMLDHIFSLTSTRDTLSGFGSLLSAIFGFGGLISGGAGAGSVNFGAPGFRHQGGQARGFTVVGEQGPELVDFRTPSRVYSNDDLASAVGGSVRGVVLNQTFNIDSTDGPGVRAAIAAATPGIVQTSVNSVTEQLGDRGSPVFQAGLG